MRHFLIFVFLFANCACAEGEWKFPERKFDDWKKDPTFEKIGYFVPREPKKELWGQYAPRVLQRGACLQLMTEDADPEKIWKIHEKDFQYILNGPTNGWIEDGEDLANSIPVPVMYPESGGE